MKTKLLIAALLASAAMIVPVQAGGHNGGGGGGNFGGGGRAAARGGGGPSFSSMPAGRFGGGPAFRSMPTRSFGGNRTIYSGQRFSSAGARAPRSMEFRPQDANSNANGFRARQVAPGNISRAGNVPRFSNTGNRVTTNPAHAGNNVAQTRNGNATLRPDWQKHVFAQHSGNWHRDWNRNADHWWHGHRCHFFNGSWVIFDTGFYPWWGWPYWDPYYYYGYGYGYGYPNGYDSNYYGEQYDDQNAYADQSGNSTVAAVQERLAREGYYRGQIDGVFGPETRAALAQFQSNHGLHVTGALTNDTLAALGLRRVASY
jgi:hypothetical protein